MAKARFLSLVALWAWVGCGAGTISGKAPGSDGIDPRPGDPVTDPGQPSNPGWPFDTGSPGDSDPGTPVPELPIDVPNKPATTVKLADLTGPGTSAKKFGVGGTDLGIPVRQPNGKIAYIFGDTFENDGVGGPGWRSPVLLRTEPGLDKKLEFISAAGGNYAKQILPYGRPSRTYTTWLPTDAITIGNRMVLHFMVNNGLKNVVWSQLAYSDDNGENWQLAPNAIWQGGEDNRLRQLWTMARGDDGYVYTMSTAFTRADPIILYRVPETRILEKNAYEPWGFANGVWAWGNPATPILQGKFGELCLRKVEHKWVLSWFNEGEYDISVKVFDHPTSDLTVARTYKPIRGGDWGRESHTSVAQLYGGYIHPDSTLNDLHLIVSQWNTTPTGGNWPYRSMHFITGVDR